MSESPTDSEFNQHFHEHFKRLQDMPVPDREADFNRLFGEDGEMRGLKTLESRAARAAHMFLRMAKGTE